MQFSNAARMIICLRGMPIPMRTACAQDTHHRGPAHAGPGDGQAVAEAAGANYRMYTCRPAHVCLVDTSNGTINEQEFHVLAVMISSAWYHAHALCTQSS